MWPSYGEYTGPRMLSFYKRAVSIDVGAITHAT